MSNLKRNYDLQRQTEQRDRRIDELQAQVEQLKIQNESFREQLVCEFMQYQEIFNYTNQGEIAKIAINHKEVIGELLEEEPSQSLNKVKAEAVKEAKNVVISKLVMDFMLDDEDKVCFEKVFDDHTNQLEQEAK